jgi:ankyrin repeat protein
MSDSPTDNFERDDLHYVAGEGDLLRVGELLERGCPVDGFDDLGKTPLHYAAENEHLDVIRLLLKAGADVNANDTSVVGNTPLGDVAGSCSYEVAKILVEAGADPTIPGWMQLTALHHADRRKKPEGRRVYDLLHKAARRS